MEDKRERKNVYFVQIGDLFSGSNESAYLPYAVGALAARAWSRPAVAGAYTLAGILFRRTAVSCSVAKIKDPFLVGFSSYVWNYEYNKTLARSLKALYPGCLIVFGGHNVPPGDALLAQCPFVDVVIHGEGEEIFEKLLLALNGDGDAAQIPNISLRLEDGTVVSTPRARVTGSDYPSPYTAGIFDGILAENPDIHFSGILETNRGCVNNCAFCDWGPHKEKVRLFPLERVLGDIDWFADNGIEYIWGADANFGQFDRDILIAHRLTEAKKRTGCPRRIKVNYAKSNHANVRRLTELFAAADMSKSTTVSLQTLSEKALENIGRRNMTLERFSDLIHAYRRAGIPTYTELILGLPGETYQTFTDGLERLMESGQHAMIEVYDCNLLPNSRLAEPTYRERHKIQTVRLPFFQYHSNLCDEEIPEYADVVVATADLSRQDWIRCKLFTAAVQCLHCLGLTRNIAIFLYHHAHIGYGAFYAKLLERALSRPDTVLGGVFKTIGEAADAVMGGENRLFFVDERLGDIRWTLDEGAFLSLIRDLDGFYGEVADFLDALGVGRDLADNLLRFQHLVMNVPGKTGFSDDFDYNFTDYFAGVLRGSPSDLKREACRTLVNNPCVYCDIRDYAREVVWYGKWLGKTVYKDLTNL